jgi:hypothetical protein
MTAIKFELNFSPQKAQRQDQKRRNSVQDTNSYKHAKGKNRKHLVMEAKKSSKRKTGKITHGNNEKKHES